MATEEKDPSRSFFFENKNTIRDSLSNGIIVRNNERQYLTICWIGCI